MVKKAYKFRFYLTSEQEILLQRTLGCVRLIYNKALAAITQAWYEKKQQGRGDFLRNAAQTRIAPKNKLQIC